MHQGLKMREDWEYLGALLANSGDDSQAAFLKAFARECGAWGTRHQVEQQLAAVNRKLTPEEIKTLSMITYEGK